MSRASRFLIGFVAGLVGLVVAFAVIFGALDATGRLKAPAFANRLSFDEKLRLMRHQGPEDVRVVFLGSSTTLHGLDGAVLRHELGVDGSLLNLGVQDLRINQIRFMANVFLPQFPRAERVVMVSTLLDYKDCSQVETAFFQPDDVLDYVSAGWPELYYYFRYLDLSGTVRRMREIGHLRNTIHDLESVSFDDYGSLLLEVPRERIVDRVWVGDPITLDPFCYESLEGLARELRARGIEFTFVIAPMRPGYLAGRDPDGRLLAEHRARVHAALDGTGAIVIDAHAALDMPEEAFFDAYHLHRDRARKLTRYVGQEIAHGAEREQEVPSAAASGAGQRLPIRANES